MCPVYNEAANIGALLERLAAQIHTPFSFTAVYDHDTDTTLAALDTLRAEYAFSIETLKNDYGRGALGAVKTGLGHARGVAVVVIMADLADDLRIVDRMYELIANEGYDLVAGSRYMPGGKQIGGPLFKRNLSRLAGVSLHLLTGLPTSDVTNNFKMYRTSFIRAVSIESRGGFEIAMELTVKAYAGDYRITEIPSTWTDRVAGTSRFRLWEWAPHYLRWYWYGIKSSAQRRLRRIAGST
ncbi:MAG TPA: glycosyltransferase [Candidatus Baltobacteraceae bacterium]